MAKKTTAYFKKTVLTTKLRLSNGRQIPWVNAGWQLGVYETSDPAIIKELTEFANAGKGGVSVIDKTTYDDLKKNSEQKSPRLEWQPRATAPLPPTPQPSPKAPSEKPSSSDAAAKPAAQERTDKPATATGVVPPGA